MEQSSIHPQSSRRRSSNRLKWVLGCMTASILCCFVAAGGLWINSALKPCQSLDLLLKKSGCMEIIPLGDTELLRLSRDGNVMMGYVTHPGTHVEFLDLTTGYKKTIQLEATSLGGGETDIALSTDGRYACVISPEIGVPQLALVDTSATAPVLQSIPLPDNDLATQAAFSPDDAVLAVAVDSEIDYVAFFDVPGGKQTGRLALSGDNIAVSYAPDGRLATGFGGQIEIWDVNTQNIVQRIGSQLPVIRSITFSPDGRYLAASARAPVNSSGSMAVHVYRVEDGQSLYKFDAKGEYQWNNLPGAFSPDGHLVAVSSCDSADIYRLEDGGLVTSFYRLWDINTFSYTDCLSAVQFLPDGTSAYYSWTDGGVVRWKLP
jgi:WD40 repeat protein